MSSQKKEQELSVSSLKVFFSVQLLAGSKLLISTSEHKELTHTHLNDIHVEARAQPSIKCKLFSESFHIRLKVFIPLEINFDP